MAEHGYARTSVRQIAAAAGVAVETIYAMGDKPEVFLPAFELFLRGDVRGTPLLELERVAPAAEAPTLPDFLRIVTDVAVDSNQRSGGSDPAAGDSLTASSSDPAVTV